MHICIYHIVCKHIGYYIYLPRELVNRVGPRVKLIHEQAAVRKVS